MKVYFHEIKDQDLSYSFTEATPWIMEIVGSLDEKLDQIKRPPNWKPRSRPTEVSFTLRRVDDLIHVSGKIKTQLFMLCSLCADSFQHSIQTQFHVLLTQSTIYAENPRESHQSSADPVFENDDDLDDDEGTPMNLQMNLHSSDFEVVVVDEPLVNFKEILSEQLVLTIPMQPKPPKNDQGDCFKCGRNQIADQLEKPQPLKENPFAVLKDFTKKTKP